MNGVHGKEDHHDRCWIDICRALRRALNAGLTGVLVVGTGMLAGK